MKANWSISLRLTIWFGVIFFLGWMCFGVAMWFNLKHTLTGERHRTLERRVNRLQDVLRSDNNSSDADRREAFDDFAQATGNGLVEIFSANGKLAYPSPSRAASAFPWPSTAGIHAEKFFQVSALGQPFWVIARPFTLDNRTVVLIAGAPETGNLLLLDNFWRGLVWSAPILLLISSAGGYWISRRALRPVDRITATARSIGIRNLSERLPVSHTGDELQRLAETCNAMLERLEASVNQLKQFTADASHELRGPLSFTRTVAEVALKNQRIDDASRQSFADIVEESAKAAVLLEDMLTLARADAASFSVTREIVDLSTVVRETCGVAQPLAAQRRLKLYVEGIGRNDRERVDVPGEFSSLRRLLWILLDNALKYNSAGGSISVLLSASDSHATLVVSDTGIGISPADQAHIFDRFYRADPSRSQVEGSGLGLAIAKWIADLHHVDLSVESDLGKGSSFRLVFSLCDSAMNSISV